jgi:co-chaperonin GroES (HSP10)
MAINAEVVAVSETGSDNVELEIYQGQPRARDYDGQFIDDEYVRNRQVKHSIRVGDIVYFHYLTLEDPHNYLKYEDGYHYFKVRIHDCFLSMRPDFFGEYKRNGVNLKTIMHNQYVLGKEYWGEGWEEVEVDGKTIAGKVNSMGLVTETREEPLENHAIITDIGRGIDPYSRTPLIKPGDVVLLKPQCEFENEVEGEKRWVFTHIDIMAKVIPNAYYHPASDYVLIRVDEKKHVSPLEINKDYLEMPDTGIIWRMGVLAKHEEPGLEKGMHVKFFKKRAEKTLNPKYVLIRYQDILAEILD